MAKGPKWFQKLDDEVKEGIEQAGHLSMGIVAGLTDTHLIVWRRENIRQWPPATDSLPIRHIFVRDKITVASRWKPGAYESEPYCSIIRLKDKVTDEKWYHIGFMVGGQIRLWLVVAGGIWLW